MEQLRRVGRYLGLSLAMDGLTALVLGVVFADRWEPAFWIGIVAAIVLIPVGGLFWTVGAGSALVRAMMMAGGWMLALLGLLGTFWGSVVGPRWLIATLAVSFVGAALIVAGRERE